ncbi:unnamed protein product [Mucor hiemalis]
MANANSLQLPESIGKRVDPTYSKTLQARLKELLHTQNDSFPGSQPVSFESKHLTDIEREDYFVCEKSDGVRYLLFFLHSSKGPASFLYDRNKCWYYVPNLLFPLRGRENEYLKDTIMDGELVLDIDQDTKTWRYLIFDLMVVNGSTIIQRSFSTRLGMLQQDVIQPFKARIRNMQNDPSLLPPFTIELKRMERSYGLHLVFEQIPKLNHKSDGIIWTPVKYPYKTGTCEKLLKWKPPELNTVDFRIAARWSKEHKPIYSIEVLSNGVTYKFYDHFQPEPALATQWKSQLPDGRIAEFRYDSDCEVTIIEQGYAPTIRKGGWRFVRFRDDKSTANDEQVVKKILNSIQDGVTKEQLLLCMDRVRAAWKAREKGLPMPPLATTTKSSTSLSLTTSLPPTTPALSTPNSANPMINSPSTGGYFRDSVVKDGRYEPTNSNNSSRNNSVSEDSTISNVKRKSSVSSTTPIKEDITAVEDVIERKRLKAVEEEKESIIPVKESINNENDVSNTTIPPPFKQAAVTTPPMPSKQAEIITPRTVSPRLSNSASLNTITTASPPPPRRRKISSVSDPNHIKNEELDSTSLSLEKAHKMRKTVSLSPAAKRTASAPAAVPVTQEIVLPLLSSDPRTISATTNRRAKSIPQLSKETATPPKKLKTISSANIHNLLTTTVEPTPSTSSSNRAYNFTAILQQGDQPHSESIKKPSVIHHQQQQQQQHQEQQLLAQQQQQQMQSMKQHQMLLAQQQQQQQNGSVFINFHAEGRQNSPQANNNHVMIIRSESQQQQQQQQQQQPPPPPPQLQKQVMSQQQKSPSARLWKTNVKYEGHQQRTPPPPPPPLTAQPYSPYNNNSSSSGHSSSSYQIHHLPHQPYPQSQQRQDPYYDTNKHYPSLQQQQQQQHMYSQQHPPPSSPYGYRQTEQQVAHEYQLQQQQQQQHQQQQQYKESQKRKNSQKAKLDFILN